MLASVMGCIENNPGKGGPSETPEQWPWRATRKDKNTGGMTAGAPWRIFQMLKLCVRNFGGLMVGNELAVSAFVNPAVWRLEDGPQAQALSILARSLGRVMPVWYGLCLALLVLESFLHRHESAFAPVLAATVIWAGVIVFTIGMLVPINNRIAACIGRLSAKVSRQAI